MKHLFAFLFALILGAGVQAAEPAKSDGWRWTKLQNASDHWEIEQGYANVEMKDGNIRAQLMLSEDGYFVYELFGTYRLGKGGSVQIGTLKVKISRKNTDFGINVPYEGTYRKDVTPADLRETLGLFRETIVLNDGLNSVGLLREMK